MLSLIFVLMQYMISAKAGLINYVDGQANVHLHEQVAAGSPIETGPQGHVELLLNPGSFLRMGERSKVVLDSVDLANITVRVSEGSALIEVAEIDKRTPIRVTTGNLQTLILYPGIYRFSGGTALVINGKLRDAGTSTTVKKGHEVTSLADTYVVKNINGAPGDDLDRWSQQRSVDLARANAMAYYDRSTGTYSSSSYYPYYGLYSNQASWIYSPFLSGFTFIPSRWCSSYYGYSFIPVAAFVGGSAFAVAGTRAPVTSARPENPTTGSASPSRPASPPSRSSGGFGASPSRSGGGFGANHGSAAGGHGGFGGGGHGGGHGGHR